VEQDSLPGFEAYPLALALQRLEVELGHIEEYDKGGWPIYIPSKGRFAREGVTRFLDADGLPYHVVVEPHERIAYASRFGAARVLTLPQSNCGIAYSRNFIREDAERWGKDYHWQIDDDIFAFLLRRDRKRVVVSIRNALAFVEYVVSNFTNIGGAGLSSWAYAFSYDEDGIFIPNRMIYGVMLLRTNMSCRWRTGPADDHDFNFQMLSDGWVTLAFKRLTMDSPSPGKRSGGNTEVEYDDGGRLRRFEELERMWPGAVEVKAPEQTMQMDLGIPEAPKRVTLAPSPIWRSFRQRPELAENAPILDSKAARS